MSEDIRKMIDKVENFKQFVNENENKPSEKEYLQALKDIHTLIPLISHKLIHNSKDLEHNEENMVKLNKEILDKVKIGDEKTLDELWDLAWSSIMKNAINIITFYKKNS